MYSQKWLSASYWEYAAKHFVRVSRFVPTKKSSPSTPSNLIGAGDLDLSIKFPFSFGDFVAVRIPDAEVRWKFDLRRDLGIYLGDADDTKRGFLILNPSTGAVQVRLDCIKLELSEQMLHSYYDSRLRLSDARPPMTRIKDAQIDFESLLELQSDIQVDPMRVSWQDLDGEHAYGGAKGDESSVATSGQLVSESVQVPNSGKMHISAEEKTYRNLRHNPRFMYAHVHSLSDMHHYQRP